MRRKRKPEKKQKNDNTAIERQKFEKYLGLAAYFALLLYPTLKTLFAKAAFFCLLIAMSGLRIYVFFKIPKHERPVYKWWDRGSIRGPILQMVLILMFLFTLIYLAV